MESGWRKHSLILFGVAAAIRLILYLFAYLNDGLQSVIWTSGDAQNYHLLAVNLLSGHGFSQGIEPPYSPEMFRTPAYPAILAAIYSLVGFKPQYALLIQTLVGALTCVIVSAVERQVFGGRSGGISGWILAGYPPCVMYDISLLTESIFTCLLSANTYFYFRYMESRELKHSAACGVLLGMATLCRPIAMFVPVILIVVLLSSRLLGLVKGNWKPLLLACAALYAGYVVCVYPWALRGEAISGQGRISHLGGADIWMRPLAYIRSLENEESADDHLGRLWSEYGSIVDTDEEWDYVSSAVVEILTFDPPYWKLQAWGLVVALYSPQTSYMGALLGWQSSPVDLLSAFAEGGVIGGASIVLKRKTAFELLYALSMVVYSTILYSLCAFTCLHNRRSIVVFLFVVLILYLVGVPGALNDARYRVPAMPYVAILSSWAVGHLLIRKRGLKGHADPTR